MMRTPSVPAAQLDFIKFRGGLDQVTPTLETKPGSCAAAENFEVGINGGYDTVTGYERFDGRPSPSSAAYYVLAVNIIGSINVGDIAVGQTSLASGEVIAVDDDVIVLTKLLGDFQESENITVNTTVEAVTTSAAVISGSRSIKQHAQYSNLAADVYRADIAAVPGTGPILGVWRLAGITYAVRNNLSGNAAIIYTSSLSGWTALSTGYQIGFSSGGTYAPQEGDAIVGASSDAQASIARVVLQSGSWAAGDAAGIFIVSSQVGSFTAENITIGANADVAAVAGNSTEIALLPNGRYETVEHNFGGQAGQSKIYGVDGVNKGFEFDGSIYVPISTGMLEDAPKHVAVHKNHLFFSFQGSAQHSGVTDPHLWSPIFGAGELAIGDVITGFKEEPGAQGESALIIYSRNSSHVLYGSSSADWNLVSYRKEVGAFEHSIQQLGITLFMDDRGVTNLQTSQAYGNFKHSSFTNAVQPFILRRKDKIKDSCICREKNQYRLFFSDNYALYITMDGNKLVGIMPVKLNHMVTCMFSIEDSSGEEIIMFGSDNGFVYQMEKGTSFDGDPIEFFLRTHFHFSRSPRVKKAYKGCALEVSGDGYAEASFTYELNYGSYRTAQPFRVQEEEFSFLAARWDQSTWDVFYWDTSELSISEFKLGGSGENISLMIYGSSDYASPLKISGAILRYLPRRQLR